MDVLSRFPGGILIGDIFLLNLPRMVYSQPHKDFVLRNPDQRGGNVRNRRTSGTFRTIFSLPLPTPLNLNLATINQLKLLDFLHWLGHQRRDD